MNSTIYYSSLMLLAGLGIPLMAALNGGLGNKLQSPAFAATILFIVGLIISITYLLVVEGVPTKLYKPNIPWYFYFGGIFVVLYFKYYMGSASFWHFQRSFLCITRATCGDEPYRPLRICRRNTKPAKPSTAHWADPNGNWGDYGC